MSAGGTGKKQYTSILPAPTANASSSGGGVPDHTRVAELPPKRQKRGGAGRFACDACRLRKSACDGQQPACSTCVKRKAKCVYTPRQDAAMSQEELAELAKLRQEKEVFRKQQDDTSAAAILERVRTLPEDQALILFRQLRAIGAGNHTASRLPCASWAASVYSANSPKRVLTSDDILPPSPLSVEFELMIRHPVLYPVVATAKSIILPVTFAIGNNLDIGQPFPEDLSSLLSQLPTDDASKTPISSSADPEGCSHPIPGELCDERLREFDVHNWLQVPVSAELATGAISFYLTTCHPILGLFDVDLFLRDLVARRTNFCSPLLLSAVLALACQGYSVIEPEAASLSHNFFAEAERLYYEERTGGPQYESATMTTAAALLLCIAATGHAREEVAATYLRDGIQMAHHNGLLAVTKRHGARHWLDGDIENVRAASHTAWGTFCTAMLYGVNYWNALIDIQPWLPIPGTTIDRGDGMILEFPLPSYMGHSFTELCKLAPLINKILHQYRVPSGTRTPFDMAEETYLKLLAWADSLPLAMGQGGHMPHHVAIVHIQFHAAVLDLFRPCLHQNPKQSLELDSFTADHRTVEDVCIASTNQLKNLLLVYRTRYSSASSCILWHNAILYVANDCFSVQSRSIRDPDAKVEDMGRRHEAGIDGNRRIWFLACIDGYKALAAQFTFISGVLQSLLHMGIVHGLMTAAEGRAYMEGVTTGSRRPSQAQAQIEYHQWMLGQNPGVNSQIPGGKHNFIVDLDGAMADPNAASVEALSQSFEQVAMFDEGSVGEKTSPAQE